MGKWYDNPLGKEEAGEHRDALPQGRAKGRGAGLNPGNRFEAVRLHVLGDHLDEILAEDPHAPPGSGGSGKQVVTRVYRDDTKTIINYVDPKVSPELGFRWTVNPYRGCEHGCVYCFARPYHEYLGFSVGLDFETKILCKPEAPAMLERELASPKWQGDTIVMSVATDAWQPSEAKLRITRGLLEVMARCRQSVSVITKNRLILRDLDLLSELAKHRAVRAAVSLTTLDPKLAARMEPRASSPVDRLHTIRELSRAGVPVAVMTAPIIPAVNDREIPALLQAAAEAGARSAGYVLLRLPYQVKAIFQDWLRRELPARAGHVESLLKSMHGGKLYDAAHGLRMTGEGEVAQQIGNVFKLFRKRYGLDQPSPPANTAAFRRPSPDGQMGLFE